jgi:hypothetical protein
MKSSDIKEKILDLSSGKRMTKDLLPNEIPGAIPVLHVLEKGDAFIFPATAELLRVLLLVNGKASFSSGEKTIAYSEKAVYVDAPQRAVTVSALENTSVLEIQWDLTDAEAAALKKGDLPFTQTFEVSLKYRDPFKSEKTVSRAIVPHRILPRFAMGSVETHGTDLIGQHAHPLLDQFFFSFPENDCILLIDSFQHPMKGNTVLHIPLGSNHGVFVGEKQCASYLWIDFIPDESGLAYLDGAHRPV